MRPTKQDIEEYIESDKYIIMLEDEMPTENNHNLSKMKADLRKLELYCKGM